MITAADPSIFFVFGSDPEAAGGSTLPTGRGIWPAHLAQLGSLMLKRGMGGALASRHQKLPTHAQQRIRRLRILPNSHLAFNGLLGVQHCLLRNHCKGFLHLLFSVVIADHSILLRLCTVSFIRIFQAEPPPASSIAMVPATFGLGRPPSSMLLIQRLGLFLWYPHGFGDDRYWTSPATGRRATACSPCHCWKGAYRGRFPRRSPVSSSSLDWGSKVPVRRLRLGVGSLLLQWLRFVPSLLLFLFLLLSQPRTFTSRTLR